MPLNPRDQRYLYELEAESIEIIREGGARELVAEKRVSFLEVIR